MMRLRESGLEGGKALGGEKIRRVLPDAHLRDPTAPAPLGEGLIGDHAQPENVADRGGVGSGEEGAETGFGGGCHCTHGVLSVYSAAYPVAVAMVGLLGEGG